MVNTRQKAVAEENALISYHEYQYFVKTVKMGVGDEVEMQVQCAECPPFIPFGRRLFEWRPTESNAAATWMQSATAKASYYPRGSVFGRLARGSERRAVDRERTVAETLLWRLADVGESIYGHPPCGLNYWPLSEFMDANYGLKLNVIRTELLQY